MNEPILVLYIENLSEMDMFNKQELMKQVSVLKDDLGYNILVLPSKESRAEIISVDKATVVEDIQKYIDLKLEDYA